MTAFVFSHPAGNSSPLWTFFPTRLPGREHVTLATHVWDQRWVDGNNPAGLRCSSPCVKHRGWLILLPLSSRSSDGLKSVHMCQRCRVTEMDAAHRRQEIQVHGATHQSLPLCSLLPCEDQLFAHLVATVKHERADLQLTLCSCLPPPAAMWWALEERRAEKILAASSNLAVGGLAHTAHGSARIHVYCSHHQHSATGSK